ncbi:ATP-binding protein [Sulfuricurvum sp.]|uniref:ATP-binding protein n=1 Tax=Sulfuricurvum sp. TaxID=2025608 RepID=UPI0026351B82|nr:ATP-binding protein [Sulfuricurvum sp.]MDD4950678.1 ATP-binding protein [Sulfuricurvum sp.]
MALNCAHEGYDYQDLITSYFILKEILSGNQDSIFVVDKKHTAGTYLEHDKDGKTTTKQIPDRFDDLVILRGSSIERKQFKYSNEIVARKLIKSDFANDSKDLALYEVFRTWSELRNDFSEFRICLAWDEPENDDIKTILQNVSKLSSFDSLLTKIFQINIDILWPEGTLPLSTWENLRKYISRNQIDRNEFKQFCDELIIELELPKASLRFDNPGVLENIVYQQAEKLGIGLYPNDNIQINDFLERLAKKVGEYRTRSSEVSVQDVLKDLRVKTDFGHLEQKFEIDQTKNIKNNENFCFFQSQVFENKRTLLIGEPGSGKSWFLTNYIDYLNDTAQNVIRHYCFTDTEDEYIEKRVSSDVFFGNLVADIIKRFPDLQKIKKNLFASDIDELNLLLSHIDKELIIIIDGLDHIDRVLKNSFTLAQDKTRIIEFISQIQLPENVYVILGSQPVDEIRSLIEESDYIEYRLPKWGVEDTLQLMNQYAFSDCLLDNKLLSEYIFEKSEGNPLYLTYIIKTLINQEITLSAIDELPRYDYNLQAYYAYLTSKIDNDTVDTLSCLEFSVTKMELGEIIPRSHRLDRDLKILLPVIVENISRGGIKLYHDSFRSFNLEKLEANANINEIYQDIVTWLEGQGFYTKAKSYRYLLKYYIKLKAYEKIKEYATVDFLTNSLLNGFAESAIKINYDNFLFVARESLDWSLFIYISELNRTIYTTISEEYHSIFLEKFELYFEAVGLIYGFERANEMLFFDGVANFTNEIIAKAFYISQKNRFTPNWDLIGDYFQEEIPLENYHYYISSLIALEIDLDEEFKELSMDNNLKDFFPIFILEVCNQIGFDYILELYSKLESGNKELVAARINYILRRTKCEQRILFTRKKRHTVLKALNLDFTSGYIKEGVLSEFYSLVREYAFYNPDELEKFEKTIPSRNLSFNFFKFFIRNFLIEIDINKDKFRNYQELENAIVANFEFLGSDVEAYKGEPRFTDISHQNAKLINLTIEQGLKYIKTKDTWYKVINFLNKVPYNTISIIESKYINEDNINFIIDNYEQFDQSEEENYSEHLEYSLKKAIYYAKINDNENAIRELGKAVYLTTSYTFHKDITLSEIIEPLRSINQINQDVAKEYAKKLKYLTDAVMKHTDDGKDTRWLTIQWFEEFLKVDYRLASMYLLDQLLNNTYFWKLDYMFVDYIQFSKEIDPVILNFLYRLSPTNNNDDYVNDLADNIIILKAVDEQLAKQSLINLLSRDLNNSRESLKSNTIQKLKVLKKLFNLSMLVKEKEENNNLAFRRFNDTLREQINKVLEINDYSLRDKTIDEIVSYFDRKDELTDKDLNSIFFFLLEKNQDVICKSILMPLIQKKFPRGENYFENLRHFVANLRIQDDTKILLLVNIFIYSKDGWYSQFVNKESLKSAVEINQEEVLKILAETLFNTFSNLGYGRHSTANLIIAFEYAGLEDTDIISMYKTAFEFLENRLPDTNEFDWSDVENDRLKEMSDNELAIVILLSKMTNLDSEVQREILFAINYFLNYQEELLRKPLKWFFENIHSFPHLSIAGLIEILTLNVESKRDFFSSILDDILKAQQLENMYIHNNIIIFLSRLYDV